ncbi:MAG: efflux RND transporter periplasmic adaptor subunit [Pirellulaceae bacterium]
MTIMESNPAPAAAKKADPLAKLRIERGPVAPASSAWRKLGKFLMWIVLVLGMAAGGLYLALRAGWIPAGGTEGGPSWLAMPEMIQPRLEVRSANVSVQSGRSADATVVATGYLESRRQAKIGARAPGRIELVNVEEGSRVEESQVLAVLEHADLDASLAAAEATLARAKSELVEHGILIQQYQRAYERAQRLHASNGVSETEFDQARFNYEGAVARTASLEAAAALAEARVREAQQMKANMFILAPFKGTVISKDAEVGESILPGGMGEASGRGSVVTVADLEHLEVDCDVKEDYISRISSGQAAEVAVDAVPGKRYQAQVRKIIPMGDRARATIKVKVAITNVDDRLFPDMSATVYFLPPAAEQAATDAPAEAVRRVFCDTSAVHRDDGGTFVWIVDDSGRLRRQDVAAGAERDGRTEILEGLAGEEPVVIAPPDARSGQLVNVAR